ncbi:MAG: glycoside hydrolase family 75 protein, partial [FCB group bacterium]|nr:glycoside hydrolase family 75 protein [FCB group bacterium]
MKSAMRTLTAVAIAVVCALAMPATADDSIGKEFTFPHDEIGQVPVYRDPETKALLFVSQMHVNIDGAPDAYHPDDIGTCHICNGIGVGAGGQWKANCLPEFNTAKAEGFEGPTRIKWFGMATEDGKPFGKPVIQTDGDPNPGYFVSTTALQQPGLNSKTPQAQLNSNEVPFIVIPVKWNRSSEPGVKLGDFAAVLRLSNEKMAYAIVGDTGPNAKLGEGSVALHQALG